MEEPNILLELNSNSTFRFVLKSCKKNMQQSSNFFGLNFSFKPINWVLSAYFWYLILYIIDFTKLFDKITRLTTICFYTICFYMLLGLSKKPLFLDSFNFILPYSSP